MNSYQLEGFDQIWAQLEKQFILIAKVVDRYSA